MGARLEKIATAELKPGFYVEWLDRPWIETPFPFQGFVVQDDEQVQELRRYCKHVFVDMWQSAGGAESTDRRAVTTIVDAKRALHTVPRNARGAAGGAAGGSAAAPQPPPTLVQRVAPASYRAEHPVEREIAAAEHVHVEASHAARDMLARLQDEGRLDMDLAKQTVEPMMASVLRNPDALIWLSRIKDHDSYGYQHSVDCSIWGLAFARHLGLERSAIYEVGLGCLLFDVGKTRLPSALLTKAGRLTPNEWVSAMAHVDHSIDILGETNGVTSRVLDMVRCHHERYDGTGYPGGLKGAEIPTFAKIAGLVDCYDAMVSPRPYAKRMSAYEAIREMYTWRGNLFQPEVVERFIQVVGVFPVGSLVELNTGEVAAVIAQNEARRLRPRLMLLLDEHKRRLPHFKIVDLLHDEAWCDPQLIWIDKHLAPGSYDINPLELYF